MTDAELPVDDVPVPVSLSARQKMPSWVWKAVAIFWLGFLATVAGRFVFSRLTGLLTLLLVSLFLALAIEPGVNRLAARGWRRGRATVLILFVVFVFTIVFVVAIGTLVGGQIANLLQDSERTVTKTVNGINDLFGTKISAGRVIENINDPNGPFQRFINSQRDRVFDLSITALGFLLQLFSVLLFTFYLVADGPRLRRSICSRLPPSARSVCSRVGSWRSPRPAATSTRGHCWLRCRRFSIGCCSSRSVSRLPLRWRCGSG